MSPKAAFHSKRLKINGISYRICEWGSPKKPLLFFLHGWMDTGASFHFTIEHLKKDYFCVAPDWRGFGKSGHTSNPLGYVFYDYIADLDALLNRYSPKNPVKLIGHSMGGNIACFYSGAFPERISHLVNLEGFGIMDMPPELAPKRVRKWIEDQKEIRRFKIYPKLDDLALRLQKTNPSLETNRALFIAQHISNKVRGGYQIAADPRQKWAHPHLHRLDSVYAFWNQIQAKTINILGSDTNMDHWVRSMDDFKSEMNRRLKQFPQKTKRKTFKNCGHMIHHEKPEELAKVIREFMS